MMAYIVRDATGYGVDGAQSDWHRVLFSDVGRAVVLAGRA